MKLVREYDNVNSLIQVKWLCSLLRGSGSGSGLGISESGYDLLIQTVSKSG